MEILGTREVKLSKLKLDGSFKGRLEAPHVADRAASIEKLGLLFEPLVRAADWRVIDGRDRIAAHMVLGRETIECKLVQCTDEECDILERVTTIERRHDPAEQAKALRELVDRYASRVQYTEDPRGPGRPKERRTVAREQVAEQLGVTAGALKMREYRAEKAKEKLDSTRDMLPPEPPVRTFGLEVDRAFLEQAARIQQFIDDAALKLRAAQGALTMLSNAGLPFPKARLDRIRGELHDVAAKVRGARPKSLCPYCKGQDGIQEQCVACQGCGLTTDSQENGVPTELLREENPMVMANGALVEMAEEVF